MPATQYELPLVRRYAGAAVIPRLALCSGPTPVQRIEVPDSFGVGALWVKHDDLSGHVYGGNKVRKLEFLLGQALAERRRAVITFGALGSNHVLATATYGAAAGLEVHAVLTPQASTPYLRTNLLADLAAGAMLHPVPSFDDVLRRAVEIRSELRERDGVDPLVIPFGGTSPGGTLGFVNAAFELADQVEAGELPEPDLVYVPLGSMGTSVGLAAGFAAAGMKTTVVGVRVVPDAIGNEELLGRVLGDVVAEMRAVGPSFPALQRSDINLELRQGFFGEGYAIPTCEGRAALEAAAQWGLRLENTYTGKALAALFADGSAGALCDKTVLFWNTYNSRPLDPPSASAANVPDALRPYLDEGELT